VAVEGMHPVMYAVVRRALARSRHRLPPGRARLVSDQRSCHRVSLTLAAALANRIGGCRAPGGQGHDDN